VRNPRLLKPIRCSFDVGLRCLSSCYVISSLIKATLSRWGRNTRTARMPGVPQSVKRKCSVCARRRTGVASTRQWQLHLPRDVTRRHRRARRWLAAGGADWQPLFQHLQAADRPAARTLSGPFVACRIHNPHSISRIIIGHQSLPTQLYCFHKASLRMRTRR